MDLSYIGNKCFDMDRVKGYNLVPLPPAKIIPFIPLPPFVVFFHIQKSKYFPEVVYVLKTDMVPQ